MIHIPPTERDVTQSKMAEICNLITTIYDLAFIFISHVILES